jgi:hypothetical protein
MNSLNWLSQRLGPWNGALLALLFSLQSALSMEIPILTQEGQLYVSGEALSREAGIEIKTLPGLKGVVACSKDRCAVVKNPLLEGTRILVSVTELAEAMDLEWQLTPSGDRVQLAWKTPTPRTEQPDVGLFAPNFRLTTLEGNEVALEDFRGKRVLINSWASW